MTLPFSSKHLTGCLLPLGDSEWPWFSAKWLHTMSTAPARAFGAWCAVQPTSSVYFQGLFGLSAGWSRASCRGPGGATLGLFASSLGPLGSWCRLRPDILSDALGMPLAKDAGLGWGVGAGAGSSFLL